MKIQGKGLANEGFTLKELSTAKAKFEKAGFKCEYYRLDKTVRDHVDVPLERAAILVVRGGVNALLKDGNADVLLEEQLALDWDTKAFMYGRVVNKHARGNLCYGKHSHDPNYEEKQGRVVAWNDISLTKQLKKSLKKFFGDKARHVEGEGNLYYDVEKCGIGFHGDAERKRVMALRLGKTMPLHYQWFHQGEPIGERIRLMLNHGDFYVMSEKATGHDWKKKVISTLRHATGCRKFTTIKPKKA